MVGGMTTDAMGGDFMGTAGLALSCNSSSRLKICASRLQSPSALMWSSWGMGWVVYGWVVWLCVRAMLLTNWRLQSYRLHSLPVSFGTDVVFVSEFGAVERSGRHGEMRGELPLEVRSGSPVVCSGGLVVW